MGASSLPVNILSSSSQRASPSITFVGCPSLGIYFISSKAVIMRWGTHFKEEDVPDEPLESNR